jgi:HSP20 family protein
VARATSPIELSNKITNFGDFLSAVNIVNVGFFEYNKHIKCYKSAEMKATKKTIPIDRKSAKDTDHHDFFLSDDSFQLNDELPSEEGQLSCDVYADANNIIVKSAMSGVDPKDLHISVSNDLLTIRGHREMEEEIKESDYYCREVYWGSFSRSIVLPQEVNQNKIKAVIKKGILTVTLPKKYKNTSIKVESIDD